MGLLFETRMTDRDRVRNVPDIVVSNLSGNANFLRYLSHSSRTSTQILKSERDSRNVNLLSIENVAHFVAVVFL